MESDSAKTIHQLFKYYASTVTASSSFLVDEDTETTSMLKEILIGLRQYVLKPLDKTVFWKWAHEIESVRTSKIDVTSTENIWGMIMLRDIHKSEPDTTIQVGDNQ